MYRFRPAGAAFGVRGCSKVEYSQTSKDDAPPAAFFDLERGSPPLSIEVIKHPVNNHTGDGDVEPQGKGPASDSLVQVEALPPGPVERDQHERHNRGREQRMRPKERKIEPADHAAPGEPRRPVEIVVRQVAGEKQGRS